MSHVQACTNATEAQSGRNFDRNEDATSLHPAVAVKVAGVLPRRPRQNQASLTASLRKLALETPPSQRLKKGMVGSPTGMTVREAKEEEKFSIEEEEKQQGAGRLKERSSGVGKEEEEEEEKITLPPFRIAPVPQRTVARGESRASGASGNLGAPRPEGREEKKPRLHRVVIVVREPEAKR